MTASLAMHNSPRISAATRARVRSLADQLGYRPDPEISRLMGRLRVSRKSRGAEVIGMLDLRVEEERSLHPYDVALRDGIKARADELGFGTSLFRLVDYDRSLKKLLRVVRNRGIKGVILLPSNQPPATLDPAVNWDGIAVMAATTSVLAPRFHQVVPNTLYNVMLMIEGVQKKGFTRLGAIIGETLEQRTAHQYSLALTWHGHRERILILPRAASAPQGETLIKTWLREHRPDIVFAQDGDQLLGLLRTLGLAEKIAVASLSNRTDATMPYQDQMPRLIGESAVSHLSGMMHNNETGVPAHPQITTIDGAFRDVAANAG